MREAALHLAESGYFVFPCEPREKRPLKALGLGGHQHASVSAAQVEAWWGGTPEANIGVACAPSRLWVLDYDPRNAGPSTPEIFAGQFNGSFPLTVESQTGGGGRHWYFEAPPNVEPHDAKPFKGWDLKALGYVLVPPSVHPDTGRTYQWATGSSPWDRGPSRIPSWLMDALKQPQRESKALAALEQGEIREGGRNDTLASIAGRLRRDGLTVAATEAALLEVNASHCVPPLPETEVRGIARSIGRYPQGFSLNGTGKEQEVKADASTRLAVVSEMLGISPPIERMEKRLGDPVIYTMWWQGQRCLIGESRFLLQQLNFMTRVADLTSIVIRRFKDDKWREVAQTLLDCCEVIEAESEETDLGQIETVLTDYLERRAVNDPADEVPEMGRPFIRDGRAYVNMLSFLKDTQFQGLRRPNRMTVTLMREAGWEEEQVRFKKLDESWGKRRYWMRLVPPERQEEEMES